MDSVKIEGLVAECKQIQEDSTYTAETHHIIGCALSRQAFWMKLIPALITVAAAFVLLTGWSGEGKPNWAAWVTLISGMATMLCIIMEPEKQARSHLFAAKAFIILKHDSRSAHESFRHFIGENEFFNSVRLFRERYNLLVQSSPATNNKAFRKASERVKAGIHEADFRSKVC